jgi:hypothetical protein
VLALLWFLLLLLLLLQERCCSPGEGDRQLYSFVSGVKARVGLADDTNGLPDTGLPVARSSCKTHSTWQPVPLQKRNWH